MFIMILVNLFVLASSKEFLPGTGFKHVSAKGDKLWAISLYNQPLLFDGTAKRWQVQRGQGTQIAAMSNGDAVLIHSDYAPDTAFYVAKEKSFKKSNPPMWALNFNGDQQVHVGIEGKLWYCPKLPCNRNQYASYPQTDFLQAAIGVDNDLWRLDVNGNVQHYVGNDKWVTPTLHLDTANPIYIDVNTAQSVVLTDDTENAYFYNGDKWVWLTANCVQATVGAKSVYCLTTNSRILQIDLAEIGA